MLAGRDRDLELATQVGETGQVEMMDRVFQPRDARILQRASAAAGLRRATRSR